MLEQIVAILSGMRKASPVLLFGIAIATAALLFMPNEFITELGLQGFRKTQRSPLGATLIVSTSLLMATGIIAFGRKVVAWVLLRRKVREILDNRMKKLMSLTPDEKKYLLPYISDEVNTQRFPIDCGIAGGLDAKGIIYRSSTIGNVLNGVDYNLQQWARERLSITPDLLDGASEEVPRRRRRYF